MAERWNQVAGGSSPGILRAFPGALFKSECGMINATGKESSRKPQNLM
jgi:hypothetical protein